MATTCIEAGAPQLSEITVTDALNEQRRVAITRLTVCCTSHRATGAWVLDVANTSVIGTRTPDRASGWPRQRGATSGLGPIMKGGAASPFTVMPPYIIERARYGNTDRNVGGGAEI